MVTDPMPLILVRVKRPGARHYAADGRCYATGQTFQMEEEQFKITVPGFFERADEPLEQIKSKGIPDGEPATGPAVAAVQDPGPDGEPATGPAVAAVQDPGPEEADPLSDSLPEDTGGKKPIKPKKR